MRVVLDSNVLLSALISPYGAPEKIYRAWRSGRFVLVTSTHQLEELRRVSRYPRLKALVPAHRVGTMVNNLQRVLILDRLNPLPANLTLADPYDGFLLAMLSTGQANYLVTGDSKAGLLQIGRFESGLVLSPGRFCTEVLGAK